MKGCMVGLGRMGITHYSIMNSHPDVTFVGVCEKNRFIAKNFERYTGVSAYSDVGRMLDCERPDFVVVATPSAFHIPVVEEAVARKVHTFVEKPFCLNVEEGKSLIGRMDKGPVVNQVGYVNRFNEVFAQVKAHLDDDLIGDLISFKAEMYGRTVLRDMGKNWRGDRSTGGGCLYEFASHCVDLVHYLVGEPDEVRGSVMRSIYSVGVEDAVYSTFVYKAGAVGTICVNWSDESYRKAVNRIELFGTKGKIVADKHAYKVYLWEANQEAGFDKGWTIRYITEFARPVRFYVRGNEFTSQLDAFLENVKVGAGGTLCSFADGLRTDATLEKIRLDSES